MEGVLVNKRIQVVTPVALHTRFATGSYIRKRSVENRHEIKRTEYFSEWDNTCCKTRRRIHAFNLMKPNAGPTSRQWKDTEEAHVTQGSGSEEFR